MSIWGFWVDEIDNTTVRLLQLASPKIILVGTNLANDIETLFQRVPSLQAVILRDVEGSENYKPNMAEELCNIGDQCPNRRIIMAGLNMKTDASKVIPYERDFINYCHSRGRETICLNFPFGNLDGHELEPFKEIAEISDFVGPQLYDGFRPATQSFADRLECSWRYRKWPSWWPRHKTIATEAGIDLWREANDPQWEGNRPGWKSLGLTEADVITRLSFTASRWQDDGILGAIYFALNTLNKEWEPYYPTEAIVRILSSQRSNDLPQKNIGDVVMPDKPMTVKILEEHGDVPDPFNEEIQTKSNEWQLHGIKGKATAILLKSGEWRGIYTKYNYPKD